MINPDIEIMNMLYPLRVTARIFTVDESLQIIRMRQKFSAFCQGWMTKKYFRCPFSDVKHCTYISIELLTSKLCQNFSKSDNKT